MSDWHAVHTQPGREQFAAGHLERQGFTVYLPRILRQRRHARQVTRIRAPLFPRYLFVRFDRVRDRWHAINGTHGVCYLVCAGDRPSRVPPGVVAAIRAHENGDGLVELAADPALDCGDQVRVTTGPLADCTGIFDCRDDRQRVVILLDLLGRKLRVPIPAHAVARRA